MKVRTKMMVGFGGCILIAVAIWGISFVNIWKLQHSLKELGRVRITGLESLLIIAESLTASSLGDAILANDRLGGEEDVYAAQLNAIMKADERMMNRD